LLLHISHVTALRVTQRNLRLQLLQYHLLLVLADLQRACIGNLARGQERKGKGFGVLVWGLRLYRLVLSSDQSSGGGFSLQRMSGFGSSNIF
jgi:hypothetical protein